MLASLEIDMHEDLVLLKDIHACFTPDQSGEWAAAAVPMILRAIPHLSSSSAIAGEGFSEALEALRDTLDTYDENDAEATAFEICDRLADVLELLPTH